MIATLRSSTPAKTLLLLAILASLLSFAKFDHCRNSSWAAPDSYVHVCYSDIPILYGARALDSHQWAYKGGTNAVEYPVVMGAVMWATSWIGTKGSQKQYFDLNALLIGLLFVLSVFVVAKIRPEFAYLFAFSPAVIAALFINWDLWGILTMLLAIYYFDKRRHLLSSALLALSIATKFFPVLLLLPIVLILWRRQEMRTAVKYVFTTAVVWLVINLPVILTTPQGWWHFYQLNLDRGSDWGSFWYALDLLGVHLRLLNELSLAMLLVVLVGVIVFILELDRPPTLAEVSFILLAGALCVGKVYSPQYVLWLAPLAVIALRSSKQLPAFWLWQAGELLYHLAIWQHLASVSGAHFGLPAAGYAIATLIRIATSLYFIWVLAKGALHSLQNERTDFLIPIPASYS